MTSRFQVEIAPEQGFALLGGSRLTLAGEDGGFLADGSAHLRAVTFRERNSLLMDALGADDPAAALSRLIYERSVRDPGGAAVDTLRALALALAGGATEDLSFAEAARRAGEREQWSWEQLLETPAWLVDRAAGAGGTLPGDGWSTFVFPSVTRFDELAAAMVENLLMRSVDEPVSTPDREAGADGPRPWSNRSPLANSPSPMSDSPFEVEVAATRMSEKKPNVPQPISPSEASRRPRVVLRHPIALEPNVAGPAQALPRSAGSAAQATSRFALAPASSRFSPAQTTSRFALAPASSRFSPAQTTRTNASPFAPSRTSAALSAVSWAGTTQPAVPPSAAPSIQISEFAPARFAAAMPAVWPTSAAAGATLDPAHQPMPGVEADWMTALARALETECDLRGLD